MCIGKEGLHMQARLVNFDHPVCPLLGVREMEEMLVNSRYVRCSGRRGNAECVVVQARCRHRRNMTVGYSLWDRITRSFNPSVLFYRELSYW